MVTRQRITKQEPPPHEICESALDDEAFETAFMKMMQLLDHDAMNGNLRFPLAWQRLAERGGGSRDGRRVVGNDQAVGHQVEAV